MGDSPYWFDGTRQHKIDNFSVKEIHVKFFHST